MFTLLANVKIYFHHDRWPTNVSGVDAGARHNDAKTMIGSIVYTRNKCSISLASITDLLHSGIAIMTPAAASPLSRAPLVTLLKRLLTDVCDHCAWAAGLVSLQSALMGWTGLMRHWDSINERAPIISKIPQFLAICVFDKVHMWTNLFLWF